MFLPISIRISHHANDGVAVCDVFHSRKDLLDILPNDDILSLDLVANDILDIRLSV
jgi:hypothetical protein